MMKNFGPKKFDNFSMLMVALGYASRKGWRFESCGCNSEY